MKPKVVLNAYQNPCLVHVLCVSKADFSFLTDVLGMDIKHVSRIVNSIETDLFFPGPVKKRQIAYMPRKNRSDSEIVCACLSNKDWFQDWKLIPLQGLSLQDVSIALKESLGFFSFGHPEGFGLPLAEAAASACELIGYSGIGGREVFDIAARYGTGYEVSYGDWGGFISATKDFITRCEKDIKKVRKNLVLTSKDIRLQYSAEEMKKSVEVALRQWESYLETMSKD